MTTKPRVFAASLLVASLVAACAQRETLLTPGIDATPAPVDTRAGEVATPLPSAPPGSSAGAPAATPATSPSPAAWVLGPKGAGPVRFGMTLAEARAAVPGGIETLGPEGPCSYVVPAGAPEGLAFMVVDDTVVRADIRRDSGVANTLGVESGDSEAEAQRLLGPSTEVTPHKYVDGHYLTAPTGVPELWWVVATDQGVVTDVRAGRKPQVLWVEGCS
jgi:hypothetical protein